MNQLMNQNPNAENDGRLHVMGRNHESNERASPEGGDHVETREENVGISMDNGPAGLGRAEESDNHIRWVRLRNVIDDRKRFGQPTIRHVSVRTGVIGSLPMVMRSPNATPLNSEKPTQV